MRFDEKRDARGWVWRRRFDARRARRRRQWPHGQHDRRKKQYIIIMIVIILKNFHFTETIYGGDSINSICRCAKRCELSIMLEVQRFAPQPCECHTHGIRVRQDSSPMSRAESDSPFIAGDNLLLKECRCDKSVLIGPVGSCERAASKRRRICLIGLLKTSVIDLFCFTKPLCVSTRLSRFRIKPFHTLRAKTPWHQCPDLFDVSSGDVWFFDDNFTEFDFFLFIWKDFRHTSFMHSIHILHVGHDIRGEIKQHRILYN